MEKIRGLDEYASDEELTSQILFKDYPESLLCFASIGCVFFIIIGIPGNLFTILALSFYKKVHNATAFFIINLSISDFLFCCTILPFTTQIFWTKHLFGGKAMCMAHAVLNYVFTAAGIFTIVAITVNRYVMVAHPNIYPSMYTNRNILIMIIAIWVGSFAMIFPTILGLWGRFSLDPEVSFCTIVPDENGHSPKTLIIIMGFLCPCTVIITCYSRIFWIVRKSTKKVNKTTDTTDSNGPLTNPETSSDVPNIDENEQSEPSSSVGLERFKRALRATIKPKTRPNRPTRRDKKLQTMIFSIIFTFFACHLPIMIAKLVNSSFASQPYGNITGYIMLYMTTCSNPIIYVVLSSEYKKAYKNLFKKLSNVFIRDR